MKIGISGINGRVGRVLKGLIVEHPDKYKDINLVAGLARHAASDLSLQVTTDIDEFLAEVDGVIDFSLPDNFVHLAEVNQQKYGKFIVSGTTGLDAAQMDKIQAIAADVPMLHAGNMSLGVNLLCALVQQTSARLGLDYDIEIEETHHRMKRDAPSGTALMLGRAAAAGRDAEHDNVAVYGRHGADAQRQTGEIGYAVKRGGGVIGAHEVSFYGMSEELTLSHNALDRSLFAEGAIFAARWLKDKPAAGLYSMRDALEI